MHGLAPLATMPMAAYSLSDFQLGMTSESLTHYS
jgi:hypothetical protein